MCDFGEDRANPILHGPTRNDPAVEDSCADSESSSTGVQDPSDSLQRADAASRDDQNLHDPGDSVQELFGIPRVSDPAPFFGSVMMSEIEPFRLTDL